MEPLLSAKEAARLLGISRRTLRRRTREGEIAAVRVGGKIMYEPDAIRAFVQAHRIVPRVEPDYWMVPRSEGDDDES
jgi:excisionase family DNA binding protein